MGLQKKNGPIRVATQFRRSKGDGNKVSVSQHNNIMYSTSMVEFESLQKWTVPCDPLKNGVSNYRKYIMYLGNVTICTDM
jgi:hypothetical protein